MDAYLKEFLNILTEFRGYILAAVGAVTAFVVAKDGMGYQAGDADERAQIWKNIKKTLKMGAGIFVLVSIALYVAERFAAVK